METEQRRELADHASAWWSVAAGGPFPRLILSARCCVVALGIVASMPGCRERDPALPSNFAVVKPGVLLRSSLPTVGELAILKQRYGIKTIVALLDWDDLKKHAEVEAARRFAAENGMNHVHMAMGFPESEQIARFLEIVTNPDNQPVLVHCVHGQVRTGMMIALFRMECEGWSNDEAYGEIWGVGADAPGCDKFAADFVQAYRPHAGYPGAGFVSPYSGRYFRTKCD